MSIPRTKEQLMAANDKLMMENSRLQKEIDHLKDAMKGSKVIVEHAIEEIGHQKSSSSFLLGVTKACINKIEKGGAGTRTQVLERLREGLKVESK